MSILQIFDSTSSFFVEPQRGFDSPIGKKIAVIAAITIGILTLGIFPLMSLAWKKIRILSTNDTNDQETKTNRIFKKEFSEVKKNEKIHSQLPSSLSPKPSLKEVAKNIVAQSEQLWEAAKKEADNTKLELDNSIINQYFIHKVRAEFKKYGYSFSNISNDLDVQQMIFQNQHLRFAALLYARGTESNKLLHQHLTYLVQQIYDNRDMYYQQAIKIAGNNKAMQILTLLNIIKKYFEDEGRSLKEIIDQTDLLLIFNKSTRLQLVIEVYLKMENSPLAPPLGDQNDPSYLHKKEAIDLAKQHAMTEGLITKLQLQNVPSDQLKKVVLQKIKSKHPDKQEKDNQIIRDLNQLLGLLT